MNYRVWALAAILILAASTAFAQGTYQSPYSNTGSYNSGSGASYGGGVHYLSADLGFMAPGANQLAGTANGRESDVTFVCSGLVGIGVDYDYMWKADVSFGGFLHYYNCSTNFGGTQFTDRLLTIGPDVRGYISTANWLFYMSTGFGFAFPSETESRGTQVDTSFDPNIMWLLNVGALYKLTNNFALGFETNRFYGLTSHMNGVIIDDFLIKGRFSL